MMKERLFEWALTDHNRITTRDERIAAYSARAQLKAGALIGYWDETELKAAKRRSIPGVRRHDGRLLRSKARQHP